jgi:hypothetical protein
MKKIELSSLNARECQRYSETVKVKEENLSFEYAYGINNITAEDDKAVN